MKELSVAERLAGRGQSNFLLDVVFSSYYILLVSLKTTH